MDQILLHNKIDTVCSTGPQGGNVDDVRQIITTNFDARLYFFTKADERWLDFFWQNGFLDVIKAKAEDPNRFSNSMPELNYLVRVSGKKPKEVTDIILTVPITTTHFNPEVIDRFLWIASSLPAEQVARVAPKIHQEQWVHLMWHFNHWGFEYEKILAKAAFEKGDLSESQLAKKLRTGILSARETMEELDNVVVASEGEEFEVIPVDLASPVPAE